MKASLELAKAVLKTLNKLNNFSTEFGLLNKINLPGLYSNNKLCLLNSFLKSIYYFFNKNNFS